MPISAFSRIAAAKNDARGVAGVATGMMSSPESTSPIPAPADSAFPPTPNFTPKPATLVPITAGDNDSLIRIASRTGVSLLLIEAVNPFLMGSILQAGQMVNIPTGPPPTTAILSRQGDTVEKIAARNNVNLLLTEAVNIYIVPSMELPVGTIVYVPSTQGTAFAGLRRMLRSTSQTTASHRGVRRGLNVLVYSQALFSPAVRFST